MKENKNTFHKELGKLGKKYEYYCGDCGFWFSTIDAIIEPLEKGYEVYCTECNR